MSTVAPTRRVLRTTTRTAKDPENANARPSRINRAKPPSSNSIPTAANGITGRATTATAASRAKIAVNGEVKAENPAAKRKREALGEVTSLVTNNRTGAGGKGKGKEVREKFDGVVINRSKTLTSRQPLQRTVEATRQAMRSKIVVAKDEELDEVVEETDDVERVDDNAMAVDPPSHTTRPAIPSLTIRKSLADDHDLPKQGRRAMRSTQPYIDDAELEAGRVFKKPRTSDPPEAVTSKEELDEEDPFDEQALDLDAEPEADPDGDEWDDLDADDIGDPLMVSEYVIDIFTYFRQIEVSGSATPYRLPEADICLR
ncbi:G2/mitotic-specific cyclin [Marasmius sp. AFHP31]|nr:G2/mitotic-specific cyclin [Marasmius sp. AFHP31]